MRASCVALLLCLSAGALAVRVKVGHLSFPLEAVKQLKELMESGDRSGTRPGAAAPAACSHPLLPQVFQPVCRTKGAGTVLSRLVQIITPVDPCELCAYPSCYGCLR